MQRKMTGGKLYLGKLTHRMVGSWKRTLKLEPAKVLRPCKVVWSFRSLTSTNIQPTAQRLIIRKEQSIIKLKTVVWKNVSWSIDFPIYLLILLLTLTKSFISNFTGGGVHQYNSLESVNELSAVGEDSEEDDDTRRARIKRRMEVRVTPLTPPRMLCPTKSLSIPGQQAAPSLAGLSSPPQHVNRHF